MLKVLDLFSGIGGFSLGLERTGGFETVAFCEIDKYCQEVLRKNWPGVQIYDDIRSLEYGGAVDVICGGFPCQDISVGGKREGISGERSSLWYSMLETISVVRPKYIILENVDALRRRGLSEVLTGLAEIGYNAEWHSIPASRVGCLHKRERLWIIGYPHSSDASNERSTYLYNTEKWQTEEGIENWQNMLNELGAGDVTQWAGSYSRARRILDEIHNRTHRLKALGNAIVPQVAQIIGNAILDREKRK